MSFLFLIVILLLTSCQSNDCPVCNNEYKCTAYRENNSGTYVVSQHSFIVDNNLMFFDACEGASKYEDVIRESGRLVDYAKCECND